MASASNLLLPVLNEEPRKGSEHEDDTNRYNASTIHMSTLNSFRFVPSSSGASSTLEEPPNVENMSVPFNERAHRRSIDEYDGGEFEYDEKIDDGDGTRKKQLQQPHMNVNVSQHPKSQQGSSGKDSSPRKSSPPVRDDEEEDRSSRGSRGGNIGGSAPATDDPGGLLLKFTGRSMATDTAAVVAVARNPVPGGRRSFTAGDELDSARGRGRKRDSVSSNVSSQSAPEVQVSSSHSASDVHSGYVHDGKAALDELDNDDADSSSASDGDNGNSSSSSDSEEEEEEAGGLSILLVDDSAPTRKMARRILEAAGHTVAEADDGQIALAKYLSSIIVKEAAREGAAAGGGGRRVGGAGTPVTSVSDNVSVQKSSYDVIVMDFIMPNMDGPTATRELRRLGYEGLILGVTGNALPTDIDHFLAHGASKVLLKPLRMAEFNGAVEEGEIKVILP
jgi:CheY-like chemotaxis protein